MTTVLLLLTLAVDGMVVNKSTGQPAAGVSVALIQAGQGGMQRVGEAQTGADGRFTIPNRQAPAGSITMLQATFQGVTYNKMLQGEVATGIELPVFTATANLKAATVKQHIYLLEHVPGELRVTEYLTVENSTNTTVADAAGTVRFYAPETAKGLNVSATFGEMGMPVTRAAKKTAQPNIYAVDAAIKPGAETMVEIHWTAPYATPAEFQGRPLHQGKVFMLVPSGMTLSGAGLSPGKPAPRGLTAYTRQGPGPFAVTVEGAGSRQNQAAEEESGEGTPVDVIPPRIYDRVYFVLVFAFGILGIAFYRLYRRPPA